MIKKILLTGLIILGLSGCVVEPYPTYGYSYIGGPRPGYVLYEGVWYWHPYDGYRGGYRGYHRDFHGEFHGGHR